MPELKLDLKTLGSIRLMPLETSALFLPFGRPVADYLRELAGNQNGTRELLKQDPVDFSTAVLWTKSISSLLRTTGFGDLEPEGLAQIAAERPVPAVAD